MGIDENTIHLISKWLKCRDAARRIYGDKYEDKIKPYIAIIKAEQDKSGTDNPLEAAIDIATKHEKILDTGNFMLLFSAAIESSERTGA